MSFIATQRTQFIFWRKCAVDVSGSRRIVAMWYAKLLKEPNYKLLYTRIEPTSNNINTLRTLAVVTSRTMC